MVIDDDEELTIDDLDDDLEEESEYGYGGSQPYSSAEGEDNSNEEPSWGPTIVVNNTTYAVSLFWQPLQDTNDPYPEVKETVDNVMEGADLFCVRSGTSPQYGIGNSTEGHKVGLPSAAAAIADIFQDNSSSVAVFEVDEGWWFIAVRNDLILSEEYPTDQLLPFLLFPMKQARFSVPNPARPSSHRKLFWRHPHSDKEYLLQTKSSRFERR